MLKEISRYTFSRDIDIHTEICILKGKIYLDSGCYLQVYFNSKTGTIAFALVEGTHRTRGIDFDSIRGWHLHPFKNPEQHLIIKPKSIKEIISGFAEVWKQCR